MISLPEDFKIVDATAKEMQPVVYKIAGDLDNDLLEKIKKTSIKVNQADKNAFIQASRPIYEEFSKEVPAGKAMIDKALALGKS